MTTEIGSPVEMALAALVEKLTEQYADLAPGVVLRVVQAARVGTDSRVRPADEIVADVEATARRDLDDLRLIQPPRLPTY
jgi:hypothetical protein